MKKYLKTFNPCDECDYAYHNIGYESNMCDICEFKHELEKYSQKKVECDFCRTLKTYMEEDLQVYVDSDITSEYSVKLFQKVKKGEKIQGEVRWHEYKLNYCPECGSKLVR